jgi:uncharacterized protein
VALHLLDVNALIALGWDAHQHHDTMVAWFNRHAKQGWATCAMTQSGFVRVLSQPAVASAALSVADLAAALLRNLAHPAHRLLALDFNFDEVVARCSGGVVGHRQITDAYLLTAAIRADARLVTFDQGVPQLLATDAERRRHVLVLG